METVLDKLVRQPTMALSRMHDIAGCRAVLPEQATADTLIAAIRSHPTWNVRPKIWDYVATPKPDGYRAKHLVVIVEGLNVEIQVRTALQHVWAELVERLDRELGLRTKFGETEPALAATLLDASNAIASYERGELDRSATIAKLLTPMILGYSSR
jgi:putative GTP pyrophosphokinase